MSIHGLNKANGGAVHAVSVEERGILTSLYNGVFDSGHRDTIQWLFTSWRSINTLN